MSALSTANLLTPRVGKLETTVATQDTSIGAAQATANTALSEVNALTPRVANLETAVGGLTSRMDTVETGVAGSMAMGAAATNAGNAANRSAKGVGFGIGASVFAGKSATAVSYAANLRFATVTASASISGNPSVQVGAGFSF